MTIFLFRFFRLDLLIGSLMLLLTSQAARSENSFLPEGQFLRENQFLRSPNGVFVAVMQDDGNFVIYRGTSPATHRDVLWAHDHNVGGCPCFAVVQGDGNFVVYHGTGPSDQHGVIWASNKYSKTDTGPYVALMQDDGNFVVYHGSSSNDRGGVQWATNKYDPVQGYDDVTSLKYDLAKAHIVKTSQVALWSTSVENDSDQPQTSNVTKMLQTSDQSNWSDTVTNTLGVKSTTELEAKVPIVGGKETVELSYQYQDAKTTGGSSTQTTEWDFSAPVTVGPHSKGKVTVMAGQGSISVPYSIAGTVVFQSGARMPVDIEGIYTGENTYSMYAVYDGIVLPPGSSPQPFKLVLAQGTRPIQTVRASSSVIKLTPMEPKFSPEIFKLLQKK